MKKILVLFTCYNRKSKTQSCINSLSHNEHFHFDYYVLDDCSSDGTLQMLQQYENIKVFCGDGNSFYSGGMRQIIAAAQTVVSGNYDYIMFINDDVAFFDNAIDRLLRVPGCDNCITVGATCDKNGNYSYGGVRRVSKIRPAFRHVTIEDKDKTCDTCCANCVLIPADIFIRLPNIDPVYRHAMGDFDYFFTAKRNGFTINSSGFYVGQCEDNDIVGTWRDTSLSRAERLKKKESVKGLPTKEWFYYLQKNYSTFTAIVYCLIPFLRILFGR